jgi:hypothetical protein
MQGLSGAKHFTAERMGNHDVIANFDCKHNELLEKKYAGKECRLVDLNLRSSIS